MQNVIVFILLVASNVVIAQPKPAHIDSIGPDGGFVTLSITICIPLLFCVQNTARYEVYGI